MTISSSVVSILLFSWLTDNQHRPDIIQALLRKSPEERLVMSVDNPCYIARNKPLVKTFKTIRGVFQENLSERYVTLQTYLHNKLPFIFILNFMVLFLFLRCTANEAFTKMMAIEKCDKVVINSLFGSGLQYKHRVRSLY